MTSYFICLWICFVTIIELNSGAPQNWARQNAINNEERALSRDDRVEQNRINQIRRQENIQRQEQNQLAWQNRNPYANHAAIWNKERNLANSERNEQRKITQLRNEQSAQRREQNQLAWQSQQLNRQGQWGNGGFVTNGFGNNGFGNRFGNLFCGGFGR